MPQYKLPLFSATYSMQTCYYINDLLDVTNQCTIPHSIPSTSSHSIVSFTTVCECHAVRMSSLHCVLASGAVYCNQSCLCVCGGQAVSKPYYNQCARSVCVSLSAFLFEIIRKPVTFIESNENTTNT